MTHDPFCYFNRDNGEFDFMAGRCARCQLIAKVREDTLEDAYTEVTGAFLIHILDMSHDHTWLARGLDRPTDTTAAAPCSGCEAIKRAVLALNRLRGE